MPHAIAPADAEDWTALLRARHRGAAPEGAFGGLFDALFAPPAAADGCIVIGRLAQTLDGRIACANGASQWIGGPGDILHTHRLRALCDVVLVGAGTVHHDDPRLTTREVPGPNPLRVVLDPQRRLPATHRVFTDAAAPTLLVAETPGPATHGQAEVLVEATLPGLLRRLAARGLRRIFVEGGGRTVSAFLAAGCLDRLHLTVAPIILGSGIPAFTLPAAGRIDQGLRFAWTPHRIGADMLFDIALHRAQPGICCEGPPA
ncbi:RibD family protein [Falsiroseomonas selenitidurans]|uniref:RibD family protein n=1 Tax=Falsiroseomonas selenitidurans TaxID=2716335 RepID=A0ABX1E010_9PROT|nr:RibD family protein [Falsiroseomonas selenitidurans]NKC29970.1 RibD family protein [Falsiroseomonas selenitidurans]